MYHERVQAASVRALASGLAVVVVTGLGCSEPAWLRLRWPSETANQLAQPIAHSEASGLELRATTITWEPDAISIELELLHHGACERIEQLEHAAMLEYDGLEYASSRPAAALALVADQKGSLSLRYELGRALRGPGARVLLRGLTCDGRALDDPPALAIPPMPLE